MKRNILLAAASVAALLLSPAARGEEIPPPESIVSASLRADADRLVAGTSFRLVVVADVRPGWHVNSHTPNEDFLIPTQVSLVAGPGLTVSPPKYPAHREMKFAFSEKPLAVYEGRVLFRFDGTVDASAIPGPRTLTATVEFQPCNDEQCLPPAKVTATLDMEVAPAGTPAVAANAGFFAPGRRSGRALLEGDGPRRGSGPLRGQVAPADPRDRLPLRSRPEPDAVRLSPDPDHGRLLRPAGLGPDAFDVRARPRVRPRDERHLLRPRRLRGALRLALRRLAPEARRPRRDRPSDRRPSPSRCSGSGRSASLTSSPTGRARRQESPVPSRWASSSVSSRPPASGPSSSRS